MDKPLRATMVAAVLLAALTGCGNSTAGSAPAGNGGAANKPLTAGTAFSGISSQVATAKLSGTVTAENDPNHLLGRPGQYTSKVTFSDSRIKTSDVEGTDPGAVERGGAVEVFTDPADAQARAKYIQAVTKSMSALTEYDYVRGKVLVRVSHYLSPAQAAGYKTAASGLGG